MPLVIYSVRRIRKASIVNRVSFCNYKINTYYLYLNPSIDISWGRIEIIAIEEEEKGGEKAAGKEDKNINRYHPGIQSRLFHKAPDPSWSRNNRPISISIPSESSRNKTNNPITPTITMLGREREKSEWKIPWLTTNGEFVLRRAASAASHTLLFCGKSHKQ